MTQIGWILSLSIWEKKYQCKYKFVNFAGQAWTTEIIVSIYSNIRLRKLLTYFVVVAVVINTKPRSTETVEFILSLKLENI